MHMLGQHWSNVSSYVGPTSFCSLAYGWPNVWAPTIKQRWPNVSSYIGPIDSGWPGLPVQIQEPLTQGTHLFGVLRVKTQPHYWKNTTLAKYCFMIGAHTLGQPYANEQKDVGLGLAEDSSMLSTTINIFMRLVDLARKLKCPTVLYSAGFDKRRTTDL